MVSSLHIPQEGVVGVRVGARGVSVVSYKTVTDGRIVFNKQGWKNFLDQAQDLHVGQAILLTGRTTTRRDLHMMFVIDIIHNNSE